MNRKLLLATLFLLTTVVQADTEFENTIPLDLAKALLSIGNTISVGIYSDVLDDFPAFEMPSGFSVLGSLDQGVMQRLVLQTDMAAAQASRALLATLTDAGWQELQRPDEAVMQPRGFVPAGGASPPVIPSNICHDEHGIMNMIITAGDNGNYVTLLKNNSMTRGALDCAQQNQQQARNPGMRAMMIGGVTAHLPTLHLPSPTGSPLGQPRATFMSGSRSSGSPNDFETQSQVAIDWDIERLYTFFAEQLDEQGWAEDSAWNGNIAAGGNWTKTTDDNLELIAILSMVETSAENYELKLRVLSRGAQPESR